MALLTSIQLRADHVNDSGDFGVGKMSNLLELPNGLLAYCYAGQKDGPPSPSGDVYNREIYFRTFDPVALTFSTPVVIEALESFNRPCGNGVGGTAKGSYWDEPQLLLLDDDTLVCLYGKANLMRDSPTFAPSDTTVYGGGIYVRESTDFGANWSSQTQVAGLAYGQGPAVTDGTNVWVWASYNGNPISAVDSLYWTYGHYAAPLHSVNMYSRNSLGSWSSHLVYTAGFSTRTGGSPNNCACDGIDFYGTPYDSAILLSATTGMVFGIRKGTSLASNPLAGPGTPGRQLGASPLFDTPLMCWRTTDGGTTWVETQVGTVTVNSGGTPGAGVLEGSTLNLPGRVRVTSSGRIYVLYRQQTPAASSSSYPAAFYSDDNGATWTDLGLVSKTVFDDNPDLGLATNYNGTGYTMGLAIGPTGHGYVHAIDNGFSFDNAISVYKSTDTLDNDPSTWEYFGYLEIPSGRDYGGWKQSSSVIHSDGHIYELEQFTESATGQEELWIIGYELPGEEGGGGEETELPEDNRLFRRGVIQGERCRSIHGARRSAGSFRTWRKL